MAGEIRGFLHVSRAAGPADPVQAEYRIAFAPVGGHLRARHARCEGLDGLTDFLRKARVPIPAIEHAWRTLARRGVHSIANVFLTAAQLEALGL